MFCNNCGNELISGAKFCNKCGQKVEGEGSDGFSGVEPSGNLQEMSTATEGKDSIISALLNRIKQHKYFVAGGLGIVVIMAVVISLFNQKGKVPDSKTSKVATAPSIVSSEASSDLSEYSQSSIASEISSDIASEIPEEDYTDEYYSDISSSLSDEYETDNFGTGVVGSDDGISYEDEVQLINVNS